VKSSSFRKNDEQQAQSDASKLPAEEPPALDSWDILGYSAYVIGLILLALGIPCLVGLVCLLLSR
jgi:hypothetical protein